jgi:hypothetical protein
MEGANCKEEVVELQSIIDLFTVETKGLQKSNSELVLSNDEKQRQLDKSIKKIKRRERVIFVLVIVTGVKFAVG